MYWEYFIYHICFLGVIPRTVCNHACFSALRPLQMTLIEFIEFTLFDIVLLNKSFASKRGFCLRFSEFFPFFSMLSSHLWMYVRMDIKKWSTLEKQVEVHWQLRTVCTRNYSVIKNNLCGNKKLTRCEFWISLPYSLTLVIYIIQQAEYQGMSNHSGRYLIILIAIIQWFIQQIVLIFQ